VFCLHGPERGRHGYADEVESPALERRRHGDLGDAGTAGEHDRVAGEGAQFAEQGAEAVQGLPVVALVPGHLGQGAFGARGRGDGVGALGRGLVGEAERGPGLSQVLDEVEGEHADENMCPHPGFCVVVDGPQVQVYGLQAPKASFVEPEVLVGPD
jgi:hypothetical protein